MNMEELKSLLLKASTEDEKNALISAVEQAIMSEKDRGIEATRKKDKDVLKLKNAIKEMGYDSEIDGDLENFINKSKSIKDIKSKQELTISELTEKLSDIEGKFEQERLSAINSRKKADHNKIIADLTGAIGDKLRGSKYIISDLVNTNRVSMIDDKMVFRNGDTVVPFEVGIRNLMEENKDLIIVKQNGGASSYNSTENINSQDFSTMSVGDLRKNMDAVRKAYNIN